MKLYIRNININRTLAEKKRNFPQATKYLTQRFKAYCDPYVPMQTGVMKNTAFTGENYVKYNGPYAHFQYVGIVMVGTITGSPWARRGEPKRYTAKSLSYSGGGQRGAQWDKRMMAQRGAELRQDLASYMGGK